MKSRLRAMLVTIAALALLATTVVAPVPASAIPTPPGTQEQLPDLAAPRRVQRIKLSPTKVQAVKLAAKARVHAMNQSGSTMNYAKMRTVFGKSKLHVDWRRQMAAGARQAGTRITHLSAAENRRIEKIRQKAYPCRACLLGRTAHGPTKLSPPSDTCGEGVSKFVKHMPLLNGKWQYSHYLNSCETNNLIAGESTCVLWAGLASGLAFIPGAKEIGGALALVSVLCGTDVIWLSVARDNSTIKHAIIIRYGKWRNQPKGSAVRDAGYFSQ